MFYVIAPPEPQPTVTPVPDISQVSDYATAVATIISAILLFVAGLAWRKANAWFSEVIADVKATKVQTTNSHETNLRDDLTLAIQKIDEVGKEVTSVKEAQERLHAQQGAIHEDLRDTRRDVRFNIEYTRDVDKRLVEHTNNEQRRQGGSNG